MSLLFYLSLDVLTLASSFFVFYALYIGFMDPDRNPARTRALLFITMTYAALLLNGVHLTLKVVNLLFQQQP